MNSMAELLHIRDFTMTIPGAQDEVSHRLFRAASDGNVGEVQNLLNAGRM